MAIPGYQDFMLPLVRIAADGNEHTVAEALEILARQMKISDADRDELLPSGTQTRFYNRVTWALTYLTKSLLLQKSHDQASSNQIQIECELLAKARADLCLKKQKHLKPPIKLKLPKKNQMAFLLRK